MAFNNRQENPVTFQLFVGKVNSSEESTSCGFKELEVTRIIDHIHTVGMGVDHSELVAMR